MDSRHLVDAQFDRAVEIVQSLPKTGPIQTGYEEKLTMYSLYKQATVGNVLTPRPSVWDMLGRAKWDAWAKHKDLDPLEAKVMYVEALIKVLRKYSDKTVARDLVLELESYNPGSIPLTSSGLLSRSHSSSSSGSSESGSHRLSSSRDLSKLPPHRQPQQLASQPQPPPTNLEHDESTSESEDGTDDESMPLPPPPSTYAHSQLNRPQSSLSSHRYRTPMASMVMTPPAHGMVVPSSQPMPSYEAPSAFDIARGSPSIPSSTYPTTTVSYPGNASRSSRSDIVSPPNAYPPHAPYRGPASPPLYTGRQYSLPSGLTPRPASRSSELDRVLGAIQIHLQALKERVESLEGIAHRSTSSLPGSSRSPVRQSGRGGSPFGSRADEYAFNVDDMGMWSIVLSPLSRVTGTLSYIFQFLASSEHRSPAFIVIRRLFLDISFLLCLLACLRLAWRRSGMRRREVRDALGGLWGAVLGRKKPRLLIDRAV